MPKTFWVICSCFILFIFATGYRMEKMDQKIDVMNNELSANNFITEYGDQGSLNYITVFSRDTGITCRVSSINKRKATINLVDMNGDKLTRKLNNTDFAKASKEGIKQYKEAYMENQKDKLEDRQWK